METLDDYLARCDTASRVKYGVVAVDLIKDTDAAIGLLQRGYANDVTVERVIDSIVCLAWFDQCEQFAQGANAAVVAIDRGETPNPLPLLGAPYRRT